MKKSTCKRDNRFDKIYHASDFTLVDGAIYLDELVLKTKRVTATQPSLLKELYHEFRIDQEKGEEGTFHFVPYNDLSYLIYAIDEARDIKAKEEHEKKLNFDYNRLKKDLPEKTAQFLQYFCYLSPNDSSSIGQYNKFTDILRKYKILLENEAPHISSCYIEVPIKDVIIRDGEIEVSTKNCRSVLTSSFEWFIDRMYYSDMSELLNKFSTELEDIFYAERSRYLSQFIKHDTIFINTYTSACSFKEMLIARSYNSEYARTSIDEYNKVVQFPISYLMYERNDGFSLLATLSLDKLEAVLSSQKYEFDESYETHLRSVLSKITNDNDDRDICKHLLHKYKLNVREVTTFYRERVWIRGIRSLSRPSKIYRFQEDYHHNSDDVNYSNSWGYGKNPKDSISYLVIDEESNEIILSPTDSNYSVYYFRINTQKFNKIMIAYVLLKYFTSFMKNKRQALLPLPSIFNYFGIDFLTKQKW